MLSKTRAFLLAANLAAAPAVCAFAIGDNPSEAVSPHTGSAMTGSGAVRDSTTDTGAGSLSNTCTYRSPGRRSGEQVGDFERSDRVATN
jgi:hypothetical protein